MLGDPVPVKYKLKEESIERPLESAKDKLELTVFGLGATKGGFGAGMIELRQSFGWRKGFKFVWGLL